MSFEIGKLDGPFGAEIVGLDLRQPMDAAAHAKVNKVFVDNADGRQTCHQQHQYTDPPRDNLRNQHVLRIRDEPCRRHPNAAYRWRVTDGKRTCRRHGVHCVGDTACTTTNLGH